LQATPGPNQTVVVVPGPNQFIEPDSGAAGAAPFMTWDGQRWQVAPYNAAGCGSLFPSDVAMVGSELYIAGNMADICGTGVDHLARYDATAGSWAAVVGALNAQVNAIEWDGNDRIYIGGAFDRIGTADVNHIVYIQQGNVMSLFDQGNLASGTNLPVRDIGFGSGGVLAVGDFSTAGGETGGTCCVALWNPGTEDWTMFPEIAAGLAVSTINEVLGVGSQIYIGGGWSFPSEPPENQPSQAAVGDGSGFGFLADDPRRAVNEIASTGGGVFFAANGFDFNLGDGTSGSGPNLGEWVGFWQPLGDNQLPLPSDIDIFGAGDVFITLNNNTRGATTANDALVTAGTALFDPGTRAYKPLGQGVGFYDESTTEAGGQIRALALFEGQLVVGGRLNFAGHRLMCCGLAARDAQEDASSWSALDSFEGDVHALAALDGALWAAGALTSAGGVAVTHAARWDGSSWTVSDSGLPGGILIRDLHVFNGELYAGASTPSGGAILDGNFLFRWTGTQWEKATAESSAGAVVAMTTHQNAIHVAGILPAGAFAIAHVARFEDGQFVAIGLAPGTGAPVSTVFSDGSTLYAGGSFASIDGITARHIAAWDGSNWSALGSGLGSDSFSEVLAIADFNDQLIAAGDFADRGDGTLRTISRIAWFDGSDWQPLANGVVDFRNGSGQVNALMANDSELWLGGQFDQAGGRGAPLALAFNIARLEDRDVIFDEGGFEGP
ncbi:MAG: hypothetical protein R3202_09465, partial [Candidatus Competibacterales bacterium]|nr:hypothetical protein [Candidatus Competibacterales bacterium]